MSVRLTSTLNVAGAPVGQPITGEVLSPASFQGDQIKGRVTDAKVSHGKATVELQFEYIHHGNFDYAGDGQDCVGPEFRWPAKCR